jgi:hypothetical protein
VLQQVLPGDAETSSACCTQLHRHPEFILEPPGVLQHFLPGDAETSSAGRPKFSVI